MTESTDESLAKALGWKGNGIEGEPTHWCAPVTQEGCTGELPRWTQSFDACLRDIVPVLDARGIGTTITLLPGGFAIVQMFDRNADRNHEEPDYIVDIGPKPLLAAFCEAALGALEASND